MRRFVIAAVTAAVLAVPSAALAYPEGGCAAPENWPPDTASIYLRTCGISLSDALAAKKAPTKHSSAAGPAAASAGAVGAVAGAAVVMRRRARVKR